MALKQKAQTGIRWATAANASAALLSVLQISVLTRFLSPSDFGLMALITVIAGFIGSFADLGVSSAIIHKQNISRQQLSSLYWVDVLMGVLLCALMIFASPFVADFYHQPILLNLMILLSFPFIINSFCKQFATLLFKDLQYKKIAIVRIISAFALFLATVGFAYNGYGVYSLVYGALISAFVNSTQLMFLGFKQYRPSCTFAFKQIKYFLNFGAYKMSADIISNLLQQLDTLLIGKLLGTEALGIYTISKNLVKKIAMIFSSIMHPTFPLMAKLQEETERLKSFYLKIINYRASIEFSIYALLIVMAPEVVLILFGDDWEKTIEIIQILAIFTAIATTTAPTAILIMAKGEMKLLLYWSVGMFFYTLLSLYFYSHWGLLGMAWGLVINAVILQFPRYIIILKPLLGLRFGEYFENISKPFLIAIAVLIFSYFISIYIEPIILKLAIVGCLSGLLWVWLNWLFNKNFFTELLALIKAK